MSSQLHAEEPAVYVLLGVEKVDDVGVVDVLWIAVPKSKNTGDGPNGHLGLAESGGADYGV